MTAPVTRQLWLQQQVLGDRVPMLSVNAQDNIATMRRNLESASIALEMCTDHFAGALYRWL
eukprot:6665739-Heterocapsa_arctica.AAC.1